MMLHQTEEALVEEISRLRRRVAELERAEAARRQALAASQQRLQAVIDNSPIVVWAVDCQGTITLSEGLGLARLGVAAGELVGQNVFELYRDVPKVAEVIRRALSGEEVFETVVIHDAVFRGWTAPIWASDGSVVGAHGVATDVTEQARAEERWHSLVQYAPDYVCTCDRDCRITFLNRTAPELQPTSPNDLIGQCFLPSAAPEHQALIRDAIRRVFDTATATTYEARWRMPDGSYRWYESHVGPLLRGGQVAEAIILGNDITARKGAEQELQALKDAFQTIAETLPGVVAMFDLERGHYTFVNEAVDRLLGYPPERLLEAEFSFFVKLIHPDDVGRVSALVRDALRRAEAAPAADLGKPEIIEAEYRVRHADGKWRWVRTSGCVFDRTSQGRVRHVLNITLDVTDLKQTQEALLRTQQTLEQKVAERTSRLQEQKSLLESILESMSDGVLVADQSARLVVFNRAAREVLGLDDEHPAVGDWRRLTGTMHADGVTPYKLNERPLLRALRGETVHNAEILFLRSDGQRRWLTVNASPLVDPEGRLRGGIAVFRDDSQRKKTELALRESLERFDMMVAGSGVGLWDCQIVADDPFNPRNPIYYSQRLKELLGFADDEFEGVLGSWAQRLHPDDAPRVFQALEDHLFRRVPYDTQQRVYTKSGELRWFQARGQAIWDPQGRPIRMSGSFADITDRKHAEEQLREEQDFLRRMLDAYERDRQLLAYDLHDGLVQDIAAAGMYFNSVDRALASLNATQRQSFDQGMSLLRTAIADGRRVLSGLRPPILDEQGIVMALHYLAVEQSVPGELDIRVTAEVDFQRLEPLLEGTIYRIVQESLTNVKRHSRSRKAEVHLMQVGERLTLVIQDWGVGFDPDEVPADHFGLEGIRKRAALLGGQVEIDSAPGRGTRIAVEFPIRVRKESPAQASGYQG